MNDEEAKIIVYETSLPALTSARKQLRSLIDLNAKMAEELDIANDEESSFAEVLIIGFIIGSVLFAISIGIFLSNFFSKKLKVLNDAALKIAGGELNISVDVDSKDEIGQLSSSFNIMSQKTTQQVEIFNELPSIIMSIDKEFNITSINYMGAKALGREPNQLIGQKCYDHFKTNHCKTENCACMKAMNSKSLVNAETIARPNGKELPIQYSGKPTFDKQGNLNGAIEVVADITNIKEKEKYLEDNVKKLLVEMDQFAAGDLTVQLEVQKSDDLIGKIFNGFNYIVNNLNNIIESVADAVQATASASNQISSSTEELAAGAQEQSSQTTEVAGAIEQMTKTILETTSNVGLASKTAKASGDIAREGGKVVADTINGMNRIAEVVTQAASMVKELGNNSDKIGEIVQVIDDIADQTNLLALNAAIEAARAGEQGRGFAVVADEVRKLAERTTKATKEIATMIKQIQKDTGNAVISMEKGTEEVTSGKKLAQKSEEALSQIIDSSKEVVENISQVAAASEEQSAASEQISKNIESISSVVNESAAGTQQIARAAEDLNRLTENLQNLVSRFKIDRKTKSASRRQNDDTYSSELSVRQNGKLIHS
ncbi:MAG: methyl-accepting chemotaxis protein [Melioribacteraceae bacterium]